MPEGLSKRSRRGVEARSAIAVMVATWAEFASLRKDPRYEGLAVGQPLLVLKG